MGCLYVRQPIIYGTILGRQMKKQLDTIRLVSTHPITKCFGY